jgi:hypothetical protein
MESLAEVELEITATDGILAHVYVRESIPSGSTLDVPSIVTSSFSLTRLFAPTTAAIKFWCCTCNVTTATLNELGSIRKEAFKLNTTVLPATSWLDGMIKFLGLFATLATPREKEFDGFIDVADHVNWRLSPFSPLPEHVGIAPNP